MPFHVLSCISLILLDLGTLGPGINETRQAIDKLHVVSLLSGCVDISMKADYFFMITAKNKFLQNLPISLLCIHFF